MKSHFSHGLTNFINTASNKITVTGKKTLESDKFKKAISNIETSSKSISTFTNETSKKVVDGSKKTLESENVKKAQIFLETSSKKVISESMKIASNITFNVFIVASLFFLVNTIFVIYGIYILFSDFAFSNVLLLLGLILSGFAFSIVAALRCYKYAKFKTGVGIYYLFQAFFKNLVSTSIIELERSGLENIKKVKIQNLLQKNGNDLIQSSNLKVPGKIRKPIMFLMELIPFGDIIVEIIEDSKRNATEKLDNQVMVQMDSFVSSLQPDRKFTRFLGLTMFFNIIVMSGFVYLM